MAKIYELYPPEGYMGGLYVSGIPKVKDLDDLHISAVVNVIRPEFPDVVDRITNYSHYNISDGKRVNYDRFWRARDDVLDFTAGGHNTVVHCRAGRNRSATVAALVLLEWGIVPNGKAAIEYVRERRPRAIANPAFEDWLSTL